MEDIKVPRLDNESNIDYIHRICSIRKENKWTWNTVRDIINSELGVSYSESYYRKNFAENNWLPKVEDKDIDENKQTLYELRKERFKISDERAQNNAILRRMSREETLVEIAQNVIQKLEGVKLLAQSEPKERKVGSKTAILELSDWHYGIEIDNPWNTYNPNIARERIKSVIQYVRISNHNYGAKGDYVVDDKMYIGMHLDYIRISFFYHHTTTNSFAKIVNLVQIGM